MALDETQPEEGAVVLYIDDDDMNRHLMTRLFGRKRPGDRLLVAASGGEGLEQARGTKVDLVLLDLTLPDMDGEEVLDALKAEHGMPVAILSGHADGETSNRLTERGADAYVTKPFDAGELFELIEGLLP